MKPKAKPCKANFRAEGATGCGKEVIERTYGLCNECYRDWLLTTPKGKEKLSQATIKAKGSFQKDQIKQAQKKKREYYEANKRKQDYEKDLEKVFNEFVRLRDADKPCISCQAPAGTYTMSAGHYYPAGSHKNIRFDEDNVHGQCWYNCNKNRSGNLTEYRHGLIARIGIERVQELDQRRNVPAHYSIPEIKDMIQHYKSQVKQLKQEQDER